MAVAKKGEGGELADAGMQKLSEDELESVSGGYIDYRKSEETYELDVVCRNCGYRENVAILDRGKPGETKGTFVCPQCGWTGDWGVRIFGNRKVDAWGE